LGRGAGRAAHQGRALRSRLQPIHPIIVIVLRLAEAGRGDGLAGQVAVVGGGGGVGEGEAEQVAAGVRSVGLHADVKGRQVISSPPRVVGPTRS
jgi:hypothetical protein